jgi:hypothetical protein
MQYSQFAKAAKFARPIVLMWILKHFCLSLELSHEEVQITIYTLGAFLSSETVTNN